VAEEAEVLGKDEEKEEEQKEEEEEEEEQEAGQPPRLEEGEDVVGSAEKQTRGRCLVSQRRWRIQSQSPSSKRPPAEARMPPLRPLGSYGSEIASHG
jgi:hypothetical protein